MDADITRHEVPVSDELIEEVWAMWEKVPEDVGAGEDITWVRNELSNATRAEDRKLLYIARVDGRMAGTSAIWISGRDPRLAEFGLPAAAPEFCRQRIGQTLFDAPIVDFRESGGEAIFLGASSYAFRTYLRAGYGKLVGSIAMVYVASGESPEAYLVDYFRDLGPATVRPGEPTDRTSAVPLVHTSHDWQVMDANVKTLSRRYSQFHGFAGQAGKYVRLLAEPDATFFAARAGDRQKVVGLSTARIRDDICSVDGFTYPYYSDDWNELIEAAMGWGEERGASGFSATVSVDDFDKLALFKALRFVEAGAGEEFLLDGMQIKNYERDKSVGSVRLERS